MTRPTVLAAGGVLWRDDPAEPEVAVVHRPRYDDWSLPKGKSKPGEHLVLTALREVTEETGHQARLGAFLGMTRYRVRSGGRPADKIVQYWSMQADGGTFEPGREVDELCWLPMQVARRRLDSGSDQVMLDRFRRTARDTAPIVLVRNGPTARPARRVSHPGAAPVLTASGRAQADALVAILAGIGAGTAVSADLTACAQMLTPFAESTGVSLHREPDLTKAGFALAEHEMTELLRAAAVAAPLVVCAQRRVLAGLVSALGRGSAVRPPADTTVEPGGWWLLHHRAGSVTAYESHPPVC